MNETSIAYALLRDLENEGRKHGVASIRRVHVSVDGLSTVVPEELVFAFQAISEGTVAEGAELSVGTDAGKTECKGCKKMLPTGCVSSTRRCPHCGLRIGAFTAAKPFKIDLVRASIERSA